MPLDTLWHDLRHGLRAWRSQASVYAIALAALALGIGANTTIFSVIKTVLIRPFPYKGRRPPVEHLRDGTEERHQTPISPARPR
jgi:hypothetical protein